MENDKVFERPDLLRDLVHENLDVLLSMHEATAMMIQFEITHKATVDEGLTAAKKWLEKMHDPEIKADIKYINALELKRRPIENQ